MIDFLSTIPHCVMYGHPLLAGMHLAGNLMIFLAYMAIPIAIEIVRRLKGIKFNALAALFAIFVFLCGIGHGVSLITDLTASLGWYYFRAINCVLTGLVSLATAVYAFKLIPTMMKIPTPEQHAFLQERFEILSELEHWRQTGKPKPPLKIVP